MFSLKYEPLEDDLGYIHILINNNDLSEYVYNGNVYYGMCRINTLTEWLKKNLRYILSPDPFPVMTAGKTGADMWLNSDDKIPEDLKLSSEFHEKRQRWLWRHSIDTCKEEFCMPFVVFRLADNSIEISWNNTGHKYSVAEFRYNCGSYYSELTEFRSEIINFIKRYEINS